MKDVNWIKIAFGSIAFLAAIWVLCAWLNPVSNNHYNPSKAYSSQQGTEFDFLPPPNEDSKSGKTKVYTDKEIEEWRASRSDLAAQWKTADMSQLAFRIGALGVILLTWTIVETLGAGKQLRRQNEIAVMTTELELQPYLAVSGIYLGESLENVTVNSGGSIIFEGDIFVTNNGKTPIYIRQYNQSAEIVFTNEGARAESVMKEPSKEFIEIPPHETKPVCTCFNFRTDKEAGQTYSFSEVLFSADTIIEYDDVFSLSRETLKNVRVTHAGRIERTDEYENYEPRISYEIKMRSFTQSAQGNIVHPSKTGK